ncbi:MAG: V-type ATP synthase subunit A [Candidatus Heimdallarchaeota archaeon]|nr:V-type ATP synthase subunit A [Candidatus Heimdallarchaeota archaeon]MDH5644518.1 V-type ATP synthase subunit A [Candidatus Heimdallarchaeota archaeon]
MSEKIEGKIIRIAGPLVQATGMTGVRLFDVARVGKIGIIGEIIKIDGDIVSIQCYEITDGIFPGESVIGTGVPLSVMLGPGMMGQIYDGIQRPLPSILKETGSYIRRGVDTPALDLEKEWEFTITAKKGDAVEEGDVIATVQETESYLHRIMVQPGVNGKITSIVASGKYNVLKVLAEVEDDNGNKHEVKGHQIWPVRIARPIKRRLASDEILITGQRIFDTFFPIAKGGVAAVPGPFGTGKTVTQHSLAKFSDAEVVVYVGCGERGNEMTQVLEEFPHLEDPKTGRPLIDRTTMIANTSNMPVAAREASVYTGVTMAEYLRDQGYSVAMMADSTSRWAEAMREISGRLEEMPGEGGYPAYLGSKIAAYYERGGKVELLGSDSRIGSVSIIGAVSPPGGDFSEPVTQNTLRIVKAFWALTKKLAEQRHFPAISYLESYTLYWDVLEPVFIEKFSSDFPELRARAFRLLQEDNDLQEIVQLVGPDALPPAERITLEAARVLKEDYLQQNAFHDIDQYCSPEKQVQMLRNIFDLYDRMKFLHDEGVELNEITSLDIFERIARMKYENDVGALSKLNNDIVNLDPNQFQIVKI